MFYPFEGIRNARSLDGIPVSGGHVTASGLLFRTADLSHATENDIAMLQCRFRLYAVVDFRDPTEIAASPDRTIPDVIFHAFPALPVCDSEEGLPFDRFLHLIRENPADLFTILYKSLAESKASAEAYRSFFQVLLEANGRPVLWHCTQGKDRTGIAAILLLSALGASSDDIRTDYFLTNRYMQPLFDAAVAKGITGEELEHRRIMSFVTEEHYRAYREAVDSRYGSIEGYLREVLGLREKDFVDLRKAYCI